jgi:hypothetical protein
MAQQLLFILRQSPDWHALADDFKQGRKVKPERFRPPIPVPGFPGNIVELVGQWNATMGVDFFSCRSRLKEMCEDSIAQIPNAHRISYREVGKVGPEIKESIAFYHDDDDWFSPDIGKILQETLPENYDICVFPLVRLSGDTTTLIRQGGRPDLVIGRLRPFSHRYQSNNYGINGRICDREMLLGMKDHVEGSEYANTHGLRDAYINRIISATAKTPCSAQAVVQIFREPGKAQHLVRQYISGLKAVQIPANLPWIAARVQKVIDLFSEAAERGPAASVAKGRPLNFLGGKPGVVLTPPQPAPAGQTKVAISQKRISATSSERPGHGGVGSARFIKFLAREIAPSSYLEIGTRAGESLEKTDCDAICVDPDFVLKPDVMKKRRRAFFFQMTSDEFFASNDLKQFFPKGVDLAFLDGMHHFEFLLRDFINTEKSSRQDSVILMRDCLPGNANITNRIRKPGPWAGDVWKMLPILKRYRPDLKVVMFDCPPTGLVACTNLNPESSILPEAYDQIVAEFLDVTNLPHDLPAMFPRGDTKFLIERPEELRELLSGTRSTTNPAKSDPVLASG